MTELSQQLAKLYETSDGSAGFKSADVEVPRVAFVIARIDGHAVGCGALRPLDEHTGEVKRMYTRDSTGAGASPRQSWPSSSGWRWTLAITTSNCKPAPDSPKRRPSMNEWDIIDIPRFHGNWDLVLAYQKDLPGYTSQDASKIAEVKAVAVKAASRREMKFALFSLVMNIPNAITGENDHVPKFQNVFKQAQLAERLGFEAYGIGERHGAPFSPRRRPSFWRTLPPTRSIFVC